MFYWSFKIITHDNKVPGIPKLTKHGNVQIEDEGFSFDGITSYLSTTIDRESPLTNPEIYSSGITFGLKLKFLKTEYEVPAYIIDTGAKSVKSRGISLYILNRKLVFELSTSTTLFKVRLLVI